MKRIVILTAITIFSSSSLFAQLKNVSDMLAGLNQDKAAVENMFEAYLSPYANSLGANLNGGWYNTAKTHKLGGFDLTFTASTSFVPSGDKSYDPSLYLKGSQNLRMSAPGNVPTIAGENKTNQELIINNSARIKMPKGTGVAIVPSPMLQLGIGLVKSTDISVRYLPQFNLGDYGKIDMWGVGLKHSLKQWIPGIKMAPFFNLSVFGGYTQLNMTSDLDLQPSDYSGTSNPSTTNYDNQEMKLVAKNFTGNVLASFDFPVITVYAGAGFSSTKTNLELKGDYPVIAAGNTIISMKDPIDMKFSNTDGSKTKPRLNAGIKFKMAIITLHFDYTYANYSVATAGLGISFR